MFPTKFHKEHKNANKEDMHLCYTVWMKVAFYNYSSLSTKFNKNMCGVCSYFTGR